MSDAAVIADTPTAPRRPPRWRSALSSVLGVLAIVGVVASLFAVWAHQVLFDPDRVAAAVDDAMDDPVVTAGLAARLTDEVFTVVDVEKFLDENLPPLLAARYAPVIAAGARTLVQDRLTVLLGTPQARALISDIVRRGHQAVLDVLNGEGLVPGLSVHDDTVTANLLPLLSTGVRALKDIGLLDRVGDVPPMSPDGDPAQQIATLEAAFGRDLPPTLGQVVVYRSEQISKATASVAAAQRMLVIVKRGILVLLVVTVALLAGTIAAANRRRRAMVALALGGFVALIVTRYLVLRVEQAIPGIAVTASGRAALAGAVSSLVSGLLTLVLLSLIAFGVWGIVATLTGENRVATSVRGRFGGGQGPAGDATLAVADSGGGD